MMPPIPPPSALAPAPAPAAPAYPDNYSRPPVMPPPSLPSLPNIPTSDDLRGMIQDMMQQVKPPVLPPMPSMAQGM
jgi:hypothetical protein